MNDTDLDSVNIHDLYLKNKPTCDTIFTWRSLCITTLYMGEDTYFYYYRNFSKQ